MPLKSKAVRIVIISAGLAAWTLLARAAYPAPAPEHMSNAKSVAHVAEFPVRHPFATIKGILYGALKFVGTTVDGIERGTAALHNGASKVDEVIDKIEDDVKPPAPAVPAQSKSTRVDERSVAIPGCEAKAFVPKGCYSQTQADRVEVRCPGQTFKFHCSERP